LEANGTKPLDFLIVDMRGRVGGNIIVAEQFLDAIARRTFYWGEARAIGRSGVGPAFHLGPGYRGRSALLIDQHTRSAGEIMAYGFRRGGFGIAVGTPTAGAVSSGFLYVMPGNLILYLATIGYEFEGGRPLEGVGVSPDERVERPLPYAAGADPVIETAVDLLTKRTQQ
jgi:carboxyl-terminal processing protease